MTRNRFAALALAPVAAVSLAGCGINSIPTADENVKARWADVQAEYQRRANLIPALVETVKGQVAAEERILTAVTEARAEATKIQVTGDQLSDPAAMQRFADAQNRLTLSLQRLQEAYPQLHNSEAFHDVRVAEEGTENRVKQDIRDYNAAVQAYNTRIRTFPDVIGAKVFYGAKPKVTYQAATANADVMPNTKFDTNTSHH